MNNNVSTLREGHFSLNRTVWNALCLRWHQPTGGIKARPYDLTEHPVFRPKLPKNESDWISFTFQGQPLKAKRGETVSSALAAHGITTLSFHPRDGMPQGLFCANGTCNQCIVLADGVPKKACTLPVSENLNVQILSEAPSVHDIESAEKHDGAPKAACPVTETEVMVVGGGPSGLAAALELGERGVKVLLVEDKSELGGKLVLQTHKFFGSVDDSDAGERGFNIAEDMARKVINNKNVTVWTMSSAVGLFADKNVGVMRGDDSGTSYCLVKPKSIIIATGSRERFRTFPGNTLPGVVGAGAFQTVLNRDGVRPGSRVLVIGGGNVGLLVAYHAIQAGITVLGVVRSGRMMDGYDIHVDRLKRLGVPFYDGYAISEANDDTESGRVSSATLVKLNPKTGFKPVPGSDFSVGPLDSILLSVGLEPMSDLTKRAKSLGFRTYACGDADQVAEAATARVAGKLAGMKAARDLVGEFSSSVPKVSVSDDGNDDDNVVVDEAKEIAEVLPRRIEELKAKPGRRRTEAEIQETNASIDPSIPIPRPVLHCHQEIPCDVCDSVCPTDCILKTEHTLTGLPIIAKDKGCTACLECVFGCPGNAITLIDPQGDNENPFVFVPFEVSQFVDGKIVEEGDSMDLVDREGNFLCKGKILQIVSKRNDGTRAFKFQLPMKFAERVVGARIQNLDQNKNDKSDESVEVRNDAKKRKQNKFDKNDPIVCKCEHIRQSEVINAYKEHGTADLNAIKSITRAGMGSCGGRSCAPLLRKVLLDAGVPADRIVNLSERPLTQETNLGALAGRDQQQKQKQKKKKKKYA